MKELELIERLSNAFGPSGFEEEPVRILMKEASGLRAEADMMNNLYIHHPKNREGRFTVMIDCHTDEVGFMVQSVNDNGTLNFLPLGGWVPSNIPAHEVLIRNSKGEIHPGIVASKPPHFMTSEEKNRPVTIEALSIDLGTSSREETERIFGIAAGDPVAPSVKFRYDEKTGKMMGKAFDNRLGCAASLTVMKELMDTDPGFNIVCAFATQEEAGLRGAKVTAQTVRPDYAIVFEGSPADDLYEEKGKAQCALGSGVQIRHMDSSYISNRRFIDFAKNTADSFNIKYQSAVRRAGGTNAGSIHTAYGAVPSLVLGIPSRFIHTHYSYASTEDFRSAVDLAKAVLLNFDQDELKFR